MWSLIINTITLSLEQLLLVDVNYPESSSISEPSVGALKHLLLGNIANSWVVEFAPTVELVVLNEVKIVAAISVSFMNTYSMNMIAKIVILYLFKNVCNFVLNGFLLLLYPKLFLLM